ncbi:hypothetical protein B0T21DRAFT_289391 [Apiosordaria backusii]|uniref:F-box domain-containing protein n=1 Tax=Apiosordaria backusii TaxID=314023 RepID=A0AA40BM44_9PEZI|nr:hypothetical protein B0T21DRAFT_289391 [Apiosordaria backusii]
MVHLLDLPDELLIQICEGLRQIDSCNTSDIKSCRLTCQRLCAASSHLLVPVVAVDCRVASLERFNDITRHPTIGKGVRAVRVPIHSYRRELSEVSASFVKFIAEPALYDHTEPELYLDNTCELDTEIQAPQGEHVKQDDHVWTRALGLIHGEYQRFYREQESLRRDGTFVNTVASALAKMPHAAVLVYDDKPCGPLDIVNIESLARDHCHLLQLDPAFWRHKWYEMLSPKTWSDLVRDDFGWGSFGPDPAFEEPQMDFVFDLPCAIANAGGQFHDIQFHLARDEPLGHLTPDITTQPGFASAMQQLEAFTVISQQPPVDTVVDNFASSFLANATNLRFLRIAFIYSGLLSEALASQPLPSLKQIYLNEACIKLADLVVFLNGLPAYVDVMYLGRVRLIEGTWAEALEALREKSYGLFVIDNLGGFDGTEYMHSAFEPAGSTRACEEGFGKYGRMPGSLSPAEAFVLRMTTTNPCRT